jgi:hypothetical protein
MGLFVRFYIFRIIVRSFAILFILSLTFALLQMPHFLALIQGIELRFSNIGIILLLKILEWLSFLAIVSFVASVLWVLLSDVQRNLFILLIQIGKNPKTIISPVLYCSLFFSLFFYFIQGWCVPYGSLYLRQTLVSLAKEKIVSSIRPKHVIKVKGWTCCANQRLGASELNQLMLNQNKPPVTVFIQRAFITNTPNFLKIDLKEGIGKVVLKDRNLMFRFQSGDMLLSVDLLKFAKLTRYLGFFDIASFNDRFKRLLFSLSSICVPFFCFTLLGKFSIYSFASLLSFVLLIFSALEILNFHLYIIAGLLFIISFSFWRYKC